MSNATPDSLSIKESRPHKISVALTKEHREFLDLLKHEDAAVTIADAISWCIDSCMKIEKLYGIDACYIAYNDIRLKKNHP